MNRYKRNLVLDVCDYSGNKLCSLYDSTCDVSGQAADVFVKTQRNGWRELSFTVPSVCMEDGRMTDNYRIAYLKADYRIRLIDDDGPDWFIISEPKVTHQAFSKNVAVTAGHVSQILKTKNLGLEFSDDEGNNIGTAAQLLDTILDGTGWTAGDVATFYERDGKTEKKRSLRASAKTGSFKLITEMCDLFDAKPVFHGDSRTVDILPMNPFSESLDGEIPDVSKADGVVELHYGKNISNVTRTLNTDNLVTKLYSYGAYGDTTVGYCGIDECFHAEYVMTTTAALNAGETYWFDVADNTGTLLRRHFTVSEDVPSGSVLIWSMLDPASQMYVWNETSNVAYFTDVGASGTELPAMIRQESKQNWYSFLMDFSYYRSAGLFDDAMLQAMATYQRKAAEQYKIAYEKASVFADSLTKLAETIGSVDFCRLAVSEVGQEGSYICLNLDTTNYSHGVMYRSDFGKKEDDYFEWTAAESINTKGDPTNEVASVIYIMHRTTPVSWDKVFIQGFDDEDNISSITLWNGSGTVSIDPSSDRFFLFGTDNMNGWLGALEIADESCATTLASSTKVVTTPHPIYFSEKAPEINPDELNGHGWWWKYYSDGRPSEMHFCYYDEGDTVWRRVLFEKDTPTILTGAYWFDWDGSALYKGGDMEWFPVDSDAAKKIVRLFGTVYRSCRTRDQLYQGVWHDYIYTIKDELPAGKYFIRSDYDTLWVFTTKETLSAGDTLNYNTEESWIEQTKDGVLTSIEAKSYRFDNVSYDSEQPDAIIIKDEVYTELTPVERSGELRGILEYMSKFPDLADQAYLTDYVISKSAQEEVALLEKSMADALGDMYREGWWQDADYVDGDEEKLYADALDNIEKIARPEATYNIVYTDLYKANDEMAYGASELTCDTAWPDLSIASAAHLIDPEIGINVWAYFDTINKCYDQPKKTTIEINTNLTTMTQHSFTDVLTNIANVASEVKGKASLFDRASAITSGGKMAAERLEGAIDTAKLKIFGGASTWYTDEMGNIVFVSADGSSAMTLTGNGFAIANSKNEWGEWNWRTFGTGDGFTADEIVAGYLSAERIEANSIGSGQLTKEVNSQLASISEALILLEPDKITQTVISNSYFTNAMHEAVSSMEVGATNMLLGSSDWRESAFSSGTDERIVIDNGILTIPDGVRCESHLIAIKPGKNYTIGFDLSASSDFTGNIMQLMFFDIENELTDEIWIPGNARTETERHTYTFAANDDTYFLKLGFCAERSDGGTLSFSRVKVEEGTVSTSWSPAPEDNITDLMTLGSRLSSTESIINSNSIIDRVFQSEKYVNDIGEIALIKEQQSETMLTLDNYRIEFSSMQETDENFRAWFDFSKEGILKIGKSGSSDDSHFSTSISNKELAFYYNTTKVAYMNGDRLNVPNIVINESIMLGDLEGKIDGEYIIWS